MTGGMGVMHQEEAVSASVYSSQNDAVSAGTMREIARVRSVVVALAEGGLRVDEDSVMKAYRLAVEEVRDEALHLGRADDGAAGGEGQDYLGGERGRRLLAAMVKVQ
jgi:exosome complex component RRP4